MPDDKRGREKQARDAANRQRMRDVAAELERMDETEPPIEARELTSFEAKLAAVDFPATGAEVVAAVGPEPVTSPDGNYGVADLVAESERVEFASAAAVRARVQRPRVATALKRIVEAADEYQDVDLDGSQYEAYEKTFRALATIDAEDEDEGIAAIREWVLEYLESEGDLPGSRDVRREAADFCREQGYAVRNDEWLGV